MTGQDERDVAQMLDGLTGRVKRLERTNSLSRGSIVNDGAIVAYAPNPANPAEPGNPALVVGTQHDGSIIAAPVNSPLPPRPKAPLVEPELHSARVNWSGTYLAESGYEDIMIVAPMDFSRVEIHAGYSADFSPTTTDTLVGTFETPRGGDTLVPLAGDDPRWIKLVVRTQAGRRGAASPGVAVTPSQTAIGELSPEDLARIAAAEAAAAAATAAADQALADAADAQATADGKVRTFFDPDPPTGMSVADIGDLWFDTNDGNKMYRWDGDSWEVAQDTGISAALLDAAKARVDAIEAPWINANSTFDNWPGTVPVGWTVESGTAPVKETVLIRSGSKAVRFNVATAPTVAVLAESTAMDPMPLGIEYVTVEIDFLLASGALDGSGVALDWDGLAPARTTLSLASQITSPVLNKWYRVNAVLRRPTGTSGTQTGWTLRLLGNSSIAGGTAAKNLVVDRLGVRPSTGAEVQAYNAATASSVTILTATVNTKVTTFYQPGIPTSTAVGDLWVDTDDSNKLYRAASAGATTIAAGQWVSARDTGITTALADAASAAAAALAAQQAADDAAAAALAAQATADGAVRTYYASNPPWANGSSQPASALGDMWFDQDDGQAYRWNGTSWQIIEDSSIAAALAAAQNAQTTADGKIDAYYQPTQPTSASLGDLWYDTDDKNKPYYCSSTSPLTWTPIRDQAIIDAQNAADAAIADAADAQATADGKVRTFFQTSAPTGMVAGDVGDLWFDSDDGFKMYRWDGAAWVLSADTRISQALTNANSAQATANGKITTFYQPGIPVSTAVGDLWVDTDDGNRLYRAASIGADQITTGEWVSVRDSTIAIAQAAADAAIADAADAQATADGKVRTFFQTAEPGGMTAGDVGDLWFDSDDGFKMYRWDGSAWVVSADTRISSALTNAAAAQQAADNALLEGNYTANPFFDNWPSGNAVPSGYGATTGPAAVRETGLARTLPTSLRFNVPAGTNNYTSTQITTLDNLDYVTVTADIYLVSGDLSGAGVLTRWVSSGGNYDVLISFAAEIPAVSTGKWYRVTKVIKRPATYAGTFTRYDLFPMGGFATIGTVTAKSIVFDALLIRPSTSAEVLSYNAATAASVTALTSVVNGKITTFYQPGIPTSTAVGDLWVDTDDGNKLYRAASVGADEIKAGEWVSARDTTIADAQAAASQALANAADAQATADGKTRTFFQTTAPTGLGVGDVGDMWFDTDDGNKFYRWDGAQWVVSQDQSLANAVKSYVQSRGTNLVTNGTGLLGDNTNFSGFDVDKTDMPIGANVSFDAKTPGNITIRTTDELIPVDPTKKFRMAVAAKQKGSGSSYLYLFLQPIDAFGLAIDPGHYMYTASTLTTLANPLNPGDTTITLTSSANWYGSAAKPASTSTHLRRIIWWDYTDPGGKLWPENTYSRNVTAVDLWADGGISGNVITLRAPYSGPAKAAGTKLSNGTSGGTFMYGGAANTLVPTTWTTYTADIIGTVLTGAGASFAAGWPAGVASCKIGGIFNGGANAIGSVATSKVSIALVSYSDAAAAQATADLKITTFYQTSAPTATAVGDLWVDTDDGNKLYRATALGTGGWTSVQDTSIAAAALAASNAMTAANNAQTTANAATVTFYQATAPASGMSTGDLWFDTDDNKAYRYNGSTWVAIQDQGIVAALNAAQNAQTTADGKITTYRQTAAPTGLTATDIGDLWFDTDDKNKPYFWDGSTWQPIRDGAITDAQTAAETAQTTANGKSTVTYSTAAPGTAPNRAGDIWFQRNGTTQRIIAMWEGTGGTSWVTRQLSSETIAEIDAGVITVGYLSGDRVDADFLRGKIMVGGTILTDVAPNARIEIDKTGLRQYDANNQLITRLDGVQNSFTGSVTATNLRVQDALELFGKKNAFMTGSEVVLATGQGGSSQAPSVTTFYETSALNIATTGTVTRGVFTDAAESTAYRATENFSFSSLYKGATKWDFPAVTRGDGSVAGSFAVSSYTRIRHAGGERAVCIGHVQTAGQASNMPGALELRVYDDAAMTASVAPTLLASPVSFQYASGFSWFRSIALGKLWGGDSSWSSQFAIAELNNDGTNGFLNLQVHNVSNDTTRSVSVSNSAVPFPLSDPSEAVIGVAYGTLGAMKFLPSGHAQAGVTVWVIMTTHKNLIWASTDLSPTGRYTGLEWPVAPISPRFAFTFGDITNPATGFARFATAKSSDNTDPSAAQKVVRYSNMTWDSNVADPPIWAQFAWKGHSSKTVPEWLTTASPIAGLSRVKRSRIMVTVAELPTPVGGVGVARDVNKDVYSYVVYAGQKATVPLRTEMWRAAEVPAGEPATTRSIVLPETLLTSGSNPLLATQGFTSSTPAKLLSSAGDVNGPYLSLDGDGNIKGRTFNGVTLEDTGWITPTLGSGWGNLGGGFQTARYCRVNGIVYIEGVIVPGTNGAIAFTLPTGFRPAATLMFAGHTNSASLLAARFDISSGGALSPQGAATWLSITCSFRASG